MEAYLDNSATTRCYEAVKDHESKCQRNLFYFRRNGVR